MNPFNQDKTIKADQIKRLLLRLYRDYKRGVTPADKAYREAFLLNSVLKAIEIADFERRLGRIEGLLNNE